MFDTVGARVMALIVATTLPLATISGLLALHSYQENVGNALAKTERDAQPALSALSSELDHTHSVHDLLAARAITTEKAPR